MGLAAQGAQRGFPAAAPGPNSPSGSAVHALDGIPDLDASVLSSRATEPDKTEAEMGLCAWGLHRLAWFCPGRNTPFLTFLDNGLVQEAHSWLIHGLQVGEGGDKGAGDIVSCGFPGPRRSLSCLFPDTRYHCSLWQRQTELHLASPCTKETETQSAHSSTSHHPRERSTCSSVMRTDTLMAQPRDKEVVQLLPTYYTPGFRLRAPQESNARPP